MRTLESKFFGSVPIARGDDDTYVTRGVTLSGRTLERSLFLEAGLGAERLDGVCALLDDLETLDLRARTALREELETTPDGTVAEYLTFHLEEIPAIVATLLQGQPATALALFDRIELCGVGVHMRSEGFALVLDYSPGRAHTDQLLAVSVDASGTPTSISHES